MKKAEHIAAFFEPSGPARRWPASGRPTCTTATRAADAAGDRRGQGWSATASWPSDEGNVVFCQLVPWEFDYSKQYDLKRTFRRASFTLTRLLANMGVAAETPLLARFSKPVDPKKAEKRWLDGLYLDQPEELDDPYRFFRW